MKRVILFIIILIFVSLLGAGAVWYTRTRPIAITEDIASQFPKPQYQPPAAPEGASTTTPPRVDQLPWGTRLASKEMPLVKGVKWKTYSNIGYGFEMQYPEGWNILSHIGNIEQVTDFSFYPPDASDGNVAIALLYTNLGLMEYLDFHYRNLSDGYRGPVRKNITINNVDWIVENPYEYDMGGDLYAENGNYVYRFGGTSFPTRNERNIVEYMIKSFRFLK